MGWYALHLPNELATEPKERLLEVVVGFGRNFKVLKVLLAVEGHCARFDFALLQQEEDVFSRETTVTVFNSYLHVNLVTAENNRNVLADTLKITVPVGHVLVGDAGSNIKHDDATLALDVVTITETTKLLLSCSIPDIEANGAKVGREGERVDFHTERGYIDKTSASVAANGFEGRKARQQASPSYE